MNNLGYMVDTYIDIITVGKVQTGVAIFSLEENRRQDVRFLEQVKNTIGNLDDRLAAANNKSFCDEEWKDFFKQWSKAMMKSNQSVLLPRSVTFGEDVYIKMIVMDIGLYSGSLSGMPSGIGRVKIELPQHKVPENHIVPAMVENAAKLAKLSLKFLV